MVPSRNLLVTALILVFASTAVAKPVPPPNYSHLLLYHIFPNGGQIGQTVTVEIGGFQGGLQGATGLLIEGPAGVTVQDFQVVNPSTVRASLSIADNASPGRRLIRVVGGPAGLTHFRYFFVGRLPEMVENEPNGTLEQANPVSLPMVVNGRIGQDLDEDCFAFEGKTGQRITARLLGHGIDSRGERRGFLDTCMDLLAPDGSLVAEADDSVGMDPLISTTLPTSGRYVLRVRTQSTKGGPQCVYRLVVGDLPCPTAMFPPGGRRGQSVEVEFSGPGVAPGSRQSIVVEDDPLPVQAISLAGVTAGTMDLPFVRGDLPEHLEIEPNNDRMQATPLPLSSTMNGRFLEGGDEDWYRITVPDKQAVVLEITAQCLLRSAVDTNMEVYDSTGHLLASNDDGTALEGPFFHDTTPFDSFLTFKPPARGDYFVRVTEGAGISGPDAVYRLTARPATPDFQLFCWPDVVPIWGPGTSAAFVADIVRWNGLPGDIEVRIEGLPEGWLGSVSYQPAHEYRSPRYELTCKALLTITAPAEAAVGTRVPFRVIGKALVDGQPVERVAQPLTLYEWNFLSRPAPTAYAVVAKPQGFWLETDIRELTARPGQKVQIPVRIAGGLQPDDDVELVIAKAGLGVRCSLTSPQKCPNSSNGIQAELTLPATLPPGRYGIAVARSWRSDVRIGMPGPCTRLILLHVVDVKEK